MVENKLQVAPGGCFHGGVDEQKIRVKKGAEPQSVSLLVDVRSIGGKGDLLALLNVDCFAA